MWSTTQKLTCTHTEYVASNAAPFAHFYNPPQHDFNVRSKAALLTEIQRQTRKGGGLSVRTLKESWKEAPTAIEELEKEGEVYVTRTQKDGQMRMVFWNEIKPNEDSGGMAVEQGRVPRAVYMRHLLFGADIPVMQSSWTCGGSCRCQTRWICSSNSLRRAYRPPLLSSW